MIEMQKSNYSCSNNSINNWAQILGFTELTLKTCFAVAGKCVEVAQSCPTLCNPIDYSLPGSFVHGILQAIILEWIAVPSPGDLPNPGIEPRSPALQVNSLPAELPGKLRCIEKRKKNLIFFFWETSHRLGKKYSLCIYMMKKLYQNI